MNKSNELNEYFECHLLPQILGLPLGYVRNLVLSVSGGVDSTVLAHLVALHGDRIRGALNCGIEVLHFNFGLRGVDSEDDARFVRELAESLGLPFSVVLCSRPAGGGAIQEWARQERQRVYRERAALKDVVVTAHHRDDRVETFLFRLLRESSLGRTPFFPLFDERMRLLRPFLSLSKAVILAWAEEQKVAFRHDASNDESLYHRNFLRHKILPPLEEIFPAAKEHLLSHAEEWAEVFSFFDQIFLAEARQKELSQTLLTSLPVSLQVRLFRAWLAHRSPQSRWISDQTVRQILASPVDKTWETSSGVFVRKAKKGYFLKEDL